MHTTNTPKQFALQLGSLMSLYLFLSFLLTLLFGIITINFPDSASSIYEVDSASSSIRLGIAMVLVFLPTYLILTHLVNKLRRTGTTTDQYLLLTKWLIYLSLLIGIGALLIDLVVIISTFLDGEITTRFTYKAAAVLAVIGGAIYYYVLDAQGFWLTHPSRSIMNGIGILIVAFTAIGYGIATIDSPAVVREQKIDQLQINDLTTIQYAIENFLVTSSSSLPVTLNELYTSPNAPTAPAQRPAYEYQVTDAGFELCATFGADARIDQSNFIQKSDPNQLIIDANNWYYTKGHYCFERTIKR